MNIPSLKALGAVLASIPAFISGFFGHHNVQGIYFNPGGTSVSTGTVLSALGSPLVVGGASTSTINGDGTASTLPGGVTVGNTVITSGNVRVNSAGTPLSFYWNGSSLCCSVTLLSGLNNAGSHVDGFAISNPVAGSFSGWGEGGIILDPSGAYTNGGSDFSTYFSFDGRVAIGAVPNDTSKFKVNGSSTIAGAVTVTSGGITQSGGSNSLATTTITGTATVSSGGISQSGGTNSFASTTFNGSVSSTVSMGVSVASGTVNIGGNGTNLLSVNATNTISNSISVGGAVNFTVATDTEALVLNSAVAQTAANLFQVNCSNDARIQGCQTIQGHGTSTSPLNVKSWSTGKGGIKIDQMSSSSDANASGLSIDIGAGGGGTAAQGIFIDATNGGTTGAIINARNNGKTILQLVTNSSSTTSSTLVLGAANVASCIEMEDATGTTRWYLAIVGNALLATSTKPAPCN